MDNDDDDDDVDDDGGGYLSNSRGLPVPQVIMMNVHRDDNDGGAVIIMVRCSLRHLSNTHETNQFLR